MSGDWIAIEQAAYAGSPVGAKLAVLGDLAEKKLWYQLSLALLEFVDDPANSSGDNLIRLYDAFIGPLEARFAPLALVRLAVAVSRQYAPSEPAPDAQLAAADAHLARLEPKRARLGPGPGLVLSAERTALKLRRAAAAERAAAGGGAALLDEVKADVAAAAAALDALPDGTDALVTATVARVRAEYHAVRGPPAAFYAAALVYLGHTPPDALPPAARAGIALDVAVAALTADGVYNFGEVAALPALAALEGTPHAWVGGLLRAVQTGDVAAVEAALAGGGGGGGGGGGASGASGARAAVPALAAAAAVVREKASLIAAMELAAARPPHRRVLSFAEVAAAARVPPDAVEPLLMRAFSLGLLKGAIDGVDGRVAVRFVAPRVLTTEQLGALAAGIDAWRERARDALRMLEEHSRDVLAP